MTTRLNRATERLRESHPPTVHELATAAEAAALTPAFVEQYERNQAAIWDRHELAAAIRQEWRGPRGRWLTVYHVERAYGGGEEGGWWYDDANRVECVDVTGRDLHNAAMVLRVKYSRQNDERGTSPTDSAGIIRIQGPTTYPGPAHMPTERPRYE
jgi:hypothetical protein